MVHIYEIGRLEENTMTKTVTMLAAILSMCVAPMTVSAAESLALGLGSTSEGGILPDTASYDWWYGCSPTSAGMLMGYYDRNGYAGLSYSNLVPGGVAEASTFPSTPGTWSYLAQYAIASPGHVADFYSAGYLGSGDDAYAGRSFDCLADFMGTSQDSIGNVNGSTTFYYYVDGARTYASDLYGYGLGDDDGMCGVGEYVEYCGYSVVESYTQYADSLGLTYGFTFEDYMAEIDAGRGVLIHVEGHTMLGVGYGDNNLVYLYDTWAEDLNTMIWGRAYADLPLVGVSMIELAGGSPIVPVPGTVVLVALGSGCVGWLRRRRTF